MQVRPGFALAATAGRVYSGGELLLSDLLATFPVALLAPAESVEAR
ncbi:hypothetical protein ABGB16_12915 [Micromonospora sp. B11E3]